MTKIIAANWKENPRTEIEAANLFKAVARAKRNPKAEVVICPPFIYLEGISKAYKRMSSRTRFSLGAQDVFWEEFGAFTSEVGGAMLRSLGAKYVIIGHSERRKWENETDAIINKKIAGAVRDGLKVILCVGEPLPIREKGISATKKFITQQLMKDLKGIEIKKGNLCIAYEPIWAIGTGKSDSPEDAQAMAIFIKSLLKEKYDLAAKFLYGGSVNSKNSASYVQLKHVDGALVGGASLKAEEFIKIINAI